ncbi:MAG: CusA/CzcA family heavy metal efflux RND transporter [Bacteroidetes bacterium]|nr:CusA/CzcA family heavy metal efflux RND transporter [Bacteroidota bacterium]
MINRIIEASLGNKLIVLLATATMAGFGLFALLNIPIGAVPDVTNNQVQVITTSRNLSTLDVERFITYPVELEMANLPGLVEIRSVSKFGLSVVTIVFKDNIGTYLPRQLIAERIQSASENIPQGFGTPFMGPISTGLGEIYQYILEVDSAHRGQYTATDLRTIQDWLVRRQLSGIPGVVEVNTWGGYLKQYEVALNPNQLKAMNISIEEVFTALEKNNSIVGGGYIEKTNQSYFIRSEGLIGSIDELNQIVVGERNGAIIRVGDIARVNFGSATRFGAITANGEGEKVLGQVMMLKGANSNQVISDVKERVAEVQQNLPEGIHINGFLERSALISKTTATIAENLILGCLIVIFVVVLLLGNMRSGLVIASVIPLSLLFALSMMYVFGVDANLMSLGAIDFGIIIDGAVIIVEFIAYQISRNSSEIMRLTGGERQAMIDKITLKGTKKLTRSAVFGQLIIIIVFIPILSLTGIEGKMFGPMAQVFTFALLGTMILGFTYVPVVSSMFLKPAEQKSNVSTRLLDLLNRAYEPSISWALSHKKMVLILALGLLTVSAFVFSRMGGEFVPTLDEGDFVIQPVFKTGTTLSNTIELTTHIEKILKTFPEVDQVVSRIGAAEVPTDPMSMEESDIIITLKPPKEWVSAKSKDELADKFKEALMIIPGIDFEFTQPIEMRFNELITGTRADLAIKIFGEDLDVLNKTALKIKSLIEHIDGASDVIVEKTAGLPEMSITYNRTKLALYGLNVDDVNKVISMAFAGSKAGEIFEGEKRFDLVIRYQKEFRNEMAHLRNTFVPLPSGGQVPLSEVADVKFAKGPAKISRDNTHRRIVVGVNVRNRDLESVVKDVRQLIAANIVLPDGYSIDYGGQFENLRSARARLMIAVPIALLLIFTLLHLAFGSFLEALMVYTAIPLSAVGGIWLLWLRDLPFSISAGVGFIALFGIAVLNGIVLIEHFKELRNHGFTDTRQLIIQGTRERLRPVLLTAMAAAMGFMPMAISTSAGAEVQRPLATVVVGGLITATLLTMIVLPVLFCVFEGKTRKRKPGKLPKTVPMLLLILLLPVALLAQKPTLSLDKAIETALSQNAGLKAADSEVEQMRQMAGAAYNIDKTQLYYNFDHNNIAENDQPLKVWGIQQTLQFPGVYVAQRKQARQNLMKQEYLRSREKSELIKQVKLVYDKLQYLHQLKRFYQQLDSNLMAFALASQRNYELGAAGKLDYLTAQAKQRESMLMLRQTNNELAAAYRQLKAMMQTEDDAEVVADAYEAVALVLTDSVINQAKYYYSLVAKVSYYDSRIELNRMFPDLQLEYFLGTNNSPGAKTYSGFQVGLAIPLWFPAQRAAFRSASFMAESARLKAINQGLLIDSRKEQLMSDLASSQSQLDDYKVHGKLLAEEIRHTAVRSFETGQINAFQYIQAIESAISLHIGYLHKLHAYNSTVIELNHFNF